MTDSLPTVTREINAAPKGQRCWICKHVSAPEDVTVLLLSPEGVLYPPKQAMDYLKSIGTAGTPGTLKKRCLAHAHHIQDFLEAPYHIAPMTPQMPLAPEKPRPDWLSVNQGAIELGNEAQEVLAERLRSGWMEDKDVIATVKVGLSASTARSRYEGGRIGNAMEELLRMAAGGGPKQLDDGNTVEGEATEVP